jgi:hypothetical protein
LVLLLWHDLSFPEHHELLFSPEDL